MELHQRITNLVQKETDRLLKEFLNDNPDLLQKYVSGGVAAVGAILTPLNAFMRHLLVIKGLDPDVEPGEKHRKELLEAVGSLFNSSHQKDFDDDYDFSWVHKKFEEARGHLKDLTKDKFLELTDLSKMPNLVGPGRYPTIEEEQEYFAEQPSTRLPSKEIPVVSPIESLRNLVQGLEKGEKFDPVEAIKKVEALTGEVSKAVKKSTKTSKRKLNKGPAKKGKGVKVNRISATPTEAAEYRIHRDAVKDIGWEKASRARKLVDEMVARGLCANETKAMQRQVEEVLLWTDDAVEAMERVVQKHAKLGSSADRFGQGPFRRAKK